MTRNEYERIKAKVQAFMASEKVSEGGNDQPTGMIFESSQHFIDYLKEKE